MSKKFVVILCFSIQAIFYIKSEETASDPQNSLESTSKKIINENCQNCSGILEKFFYCCRLPQTVSDDLYDKYRAELAQSNIGKLSNRKMENCKKKEIWLKTIGMLGQGKNSEEITVESAVKFFEQNLSNRSEWIEIFTNATINCLSVVKEFVDDFQVKLGFKKEICNAQFLLVEACLFLDVMANCPYDAKSKYAKCDSERKLVSECKNEFHIIEKTYEILVEFR